MEASTIFGIAITAVASGGVLLALVYIGARVMARTSVPATASPAVQASSLAGATDAVLVARRGGYVVYANDRAKQLFAISGGKPNLNTMARLTQPQDAFLDLFAGEGQTAVTVANRPWQATSVHVPGDEGRFVILLRESDQLAGPHAPGRRGGAVAALNELDKSLSASLDLNDTVNNVLQIAVRIMHFDLAELCLWDADTRLLRPAARAGDRVYVTALDRRITSYTVDEGYTGWIARNKRPLLVGDAQRRADVQPKLDRADFPIQSIVGVPVLHGSERELVGTLELASFGLEAYNSQDASLLESVADRAAVAIRNAQLYAAQTNRIAELTGLTQLAQTASVLASPREFYANLVDRIAKLMNVQMCGFMLYNEAGRSLVSQPPFRGMPDAIVETYRIPLPANSRADRLWREEDFWYSNDAAHDPVIEEMGLKEVSEMVGLRTTLLVPLQVSGNRLGMVQVSNKAGEAAFTDDDARLLRMFAGQAAVLIDNARLVREAEERVQRAEALRQISEIAGSARNLEEIFRAVMQIAAQILKIDLGVTLLADEAKGELAPVPGSEFGGSIQEAEFARLRTDDPNFKYSVTATRRPFYTRRASGDRRITGLYRRALARYKVESVIIAPLIVQDKSIGEIMLGTRQERALQRTDVALVATVAAQLASAVERTRLASATDETLSRRIEQLTALTRVGRELNQTIELERILQTVYDEALHAAGADCGSILLLDNTAATPAARSRLGHDGNHLTLNAIEADVAATGASYLIPDLSAPDALSNFQLSDERPGLHEGVRCMLIVPILYQGGTVGTIELHSHQPNRFDRAILDFSQALSAQAAIAAGNAQRFEEQLQRSELLRHRSDQLAQLLQISRAVRSDRPLVSNLETIAYGVQDAVGFNVALIGVIDTDSNMLHRMVGAGVPLAAFERLKNTPQPWASYQAALKPEFRMSQSYYIPHAKTPPELLELDAGTTAHEAAEPMPGHWHPNDYLFVPLLGSGGQALGVMSLADPRSGRAPDRLTIEALEIFANQAALAIENARLYESAQRRAAELSHSLAELQQSYKDLDAISRTLSRKDAELSSLIRQADLRAARLLALHRIAGATAEIREAAALLDAVAQTTAAEMNLDVCVIGVVRDSDVQVAARAGTDEPVAALSAQLVTLNPITQTIMLHTPLLARDLGQHGWGESAVIQTLKLRSFVTVPITTAGYLSGAVLLGSRAEVSPFNAEDIDLFTILAGQIGIGLENIRLYAETGQRATQLEALTEVSRVISSAVRQEEVVSLVLEQVGRVIPYDSATLWLREDDFLRVASARGFENDAEQLGLLVNIEDSRLFQEMSKTHRTIVVPDVRRDERFPAGVISRTLSWLGVPLTSKGHVLGLLALDKVEVGFYSTQHAELAMAFANQAAVSLDNAQLFEESVQRAMQLNERSQRLALLNRVSSELNTTLDTERISEIAAREMSNAIGNARVTAVLFDLADQMGRLVAEQPANFLQPALPAFSLDGDPLTQRLRETALPVTLDDVAQSDLLAAPMRQALIGAGVRTLLVVPVVTGDNVSGCVLINRPDRDQYTPGEIELAQTIANQTAIALDKARLFATVQQYTADLEERVAQRTTALARERDRVETLLRITNELSSSLDLDRVLTRALTLVSELIGGTQGSLFLLDPQSDTLIYRAALGVNFQLPPGGRPAPFRRGEGLVGWVIKHRQPVIVGNLLEDERWIKRPLSDQHRSAICVPLVTSEDSLGAMVFYSDQFDNFTEDQLRLVSAAANQVTSAINNAELYRLIRDQAERLGSMLRANQIEASKSRAILESVADGVMVTDPHGKIILFNATAEHILRLERDHVLGHPADDFMGFYGASARTLTDAIDRWSADSSTIEPGDPLSERIELDDRRIISILLAPVTSTDEYLGSVSIFRDITREVEVDRLKTEFVTNVSHELRTPMTSIKGYADLLLMGAGGAVSPEQQRFLDIIKTNADRLRILLDDLLDVSKIESGRVELNMVPLPMADLVAEAADHVRERSQRHDKPMTVITDVPPDLPPVWGDRQRLTQVVSNLADNAFNYTDAGGRIVIFARRDGNTIVVSVADNGIGIAPEDQARIFERFYRVENPLVMASAGTGLGLSIVQHLVKMHGGQIWVESEPGRGSTFFVRLNLAEEAPPGSAATEQPAAQP